MNNEILKTIFEQKYVYYLIGVAVVLIFITILFLIPQTREVLQIFLLRIKKININQKETSVELLEDNSKVFSENKGVNDIRQKKENITDPTIIDLKISKFKKVKIKNFFGKLKSRFVIMEDVEINGGRSNNVKNRK